MEKNSQEPDTTNKSQNAGATNNQRATGVVLNFKNTACNKSKEGTAEQREASERCKLVEILTAESPTNNKGGFHGDPVEDPASEPPPRPSRTPSAEPRPTHRDSVEVDCDHQMDVSLTFSPELHLLSLDYCNFPDIPEKMEMHGDESESQWADVVDLFGIGSSSSSSNNVGGFFDIGAYFESICSCKSDSSEQTVDSQPLGWLSDQWEGTCSNARLDEQDVELTVTPEGTYGSVSSCPQMDRQTVVIQSQQPTAEIHNSSPHSSTQGSQASCTLTGNQHFHFEGVAQSFSVPPHIQHCSIPTPPPHEDDWLFTYILKDRASSDFWE